MSRKPAIKTVLIVEDNVDAADSLAMLIELRGHKALIAHDAETGLKVAHATHPDVIIHDINLPKMNGYLAAAALRADQSLASSVLVALTGYAREEDKKRALSAGFDIHMAKPLNFAALSAAVGL
jgi:DNA-binding response OmpR family regulator